MRTTILTCVLAAVSAAPMLAQRARPAQSPRLDYLSGYLGLSDSQKTQAKAVFDSSAADASSLRSQLAGARDALRAAVKTNASDSELDRLGDAVGDLEGRLAASQAKASARFYQLLTADQRAKYDQMGAQVTARSRPGPQHGLRR